MAFTEIRTINGKKYYYRVISIRTGNKISKKRIYLGTGLLNSEIAKKEKEADRKMVPEKKTNKEIEKIKSKIIEVLKENKVSKAGIFGSYSRGEQKKNSDIDILIEIKDPNMSLLGFIHIKHKLEDILRKKVDLVEYKVIRPEIKKTILEEEVRII
ncbi:MAG: nucleotidyltransferase family protein [Nanoarchaeota archaeon]